MKLNVGKYRINYRTEYGEINPLHIEAARFAQRAPAGTNPSSEAEIPPTYNVGVLFMGTLFGGPFVRTKSLLHPRPLRNEAGFTMIELLWVMGIILILTSIGWVQYVSYIKNAEFTKAELALKDARTALEAGFDYIAGAGMVAGVSGSHGEPLAGALAAALPGMNVSDRVQLQLSSFNCGDGINFMQQITVSACEAQLFTWWLRTCGGFEIKAPRQAMAGAC